ncbi:MAG TPA: DUF4229 domain-containing protein [Actinoplanes sp.]|nr:DUF4229 domain-containing protein [Actinoplanes sp.]
MSPAVKYTLGRLGLFVVVLAMLLPVPLNFLVKVMIALVASAAFAFFLLAKWRNEMAEQLGAAADRRRAEKDRLRAALAGDEAAAAAGGAGERAGGVDTGGRAGGSAGERAGGSARERAGGVDTGGRAGGSAGERADNDSPGGGRAAGS